MAWYRNCYYCEECSSGWEDEWSCGCDDECPECGRDFSPFDSIDLSAYLEKTNDDTYQIYFSPPHADDKPDYTLFAEVTMRNLALALEQLAKEMAVPA